MMPNHPMSSVVYTSLLLNQGTTYRPEAWPSSDGSIRCSVDFDPRGGRCCIQGQPAALRELADALLAAVHAAEQTNRANGGVAG
jgi:hypothetical protein